MKAQSYYQNVSICENTTAWTGWAEFLQNCDTNIQIQIHKCKRIAIIKMFQFVRMQPPGPDGPSICETGIGMFSFRQRQSGPQQLLS